MEVVNRRVMPADSEVVGPCYSVRIAHHG